MALGLVAGLGMSWGVGSLFSAAAPQSIGEPPFEGPVESLEISGAEDRYTDVDESRAMLEAARAPKEFFVFPGAAHVDFYAHDPKAYSELVLDFLDRRLLPSK